MSLYTSNDIKFRKADKTDAAILLKLKNESWFGTHTVTITNLTSQEKFLESINCETHCPRNLILIASTKLEEDEDVGVIKLFNTDWQSRKSEIGWDIFAPFRGKGLGKKLVQAGVDFGFDVLNLRRLDAQILKTNAVSIKCALAAGFEIEGTQRKAIHKRGEYIDNLILGVLKDEKIN